jgi:hypothetical protein
MNDKSFSGNDLEKALASGVLSALAPTLVGLVKKSEKVGHVSFSHSGCSAWIDLPTEMIERADHVGERACRDHFHPEVRILLREPSSPEAKVLIALLAQVSTEHMVNIPIMAMEQFDSGSDSVITLPGRRIGCRIVYVCTRT